MNPNSKVVGGKPKQGPETHLQRCVEFRGPADSGDNALQGSCRAFSTCEARGCENDAAAQRQEHVFTVFFIQ